MKLFTQQNCRFFSLNNAQKTRLIFVRKSPCIFTKCLSKKISRFLRNDVRKILFHTGRQRLHFRCSCVRCPLLQFAFWFVGTNCELYIANRLLGLKAAAKLAIEICSAAVAVPAHSRLSCLTAAFPESREMLRFLLPALGWKGSRHVNIPRQQKRQLHSYEQPPPTG